MSQVSAWLAPDPVLPHRDELLDGETMRTRWSRVLAQSDHLTIDACERVRVNYELGKSLRTLYRLRMNGTERLVASRMFRQGRSAAAFSATTEIAEVDGGLRAIAHDPALEAVYWAFPNDRKIKALPLLVTPTPEVTRFLSDQWVTSQVVAYAPEKTATAACFNSQGRLLAFVKVASADQTERDYGYYEAVRATLSSDDPRLIVPAPIAFSAQHRMLWLEALDGHRVGENGSDWLSDARAMGAAVARFHGCAVPDAPAFDRFDPDRLGTAARIVASVRPDLADAVMALTRHLVDRTPAPGTSACLHGDLHPKNALVCGNRVALLDLEDLAIGPAACDIGSFLGALEYSRTADALSPEACLKRGAAFLAGYELVAALPDRSSLGWYVAASLFVERAVRAVTRIRPLGLNQLPALVERADRILDGEIDAVGWGHR
jgi:Ser/Thr protein kinase RdoA (MazF antagonist)